MHLGDKEIELNHAFAYRGKFFEDPCIVLVLSEIPVSDEKRTRLQEQLAENPENAMFFAEGANVSLTLSEDGELMSMFAWADNTSISRSRGAAVEVAIKGDTINGRAGMASEGSGEHDLEFHAEFDTEISF